MKLSMPSLKMSSFKLKGLSIRDAYEKMRTGGAQMTPEQRRKSLISTGAILLMGGLAFFTFYNFLQVLKINTDEYSTQMAPPRKNDEIKKRGEELNAKYNAYTSLREGTQQLVAIEDAIGRSPVSQVVPPPAVATETAVPEFVPTVKIKALIVLGGSSICTLDIDGEETGQIYKPGTSFGGGKGRILSIDLKGVSWSWANKKHRTDL